MEQLLYIFIFFYPVFLLVTVSLIVSGWLARSVKREEAQQKRRRIAAGQTVENAVQKLTLGSFAKQFAWKLLSGIVWVALAIALTIVLTLALFWLSRPGGLSHLF